MRRVRGFGLILAGLSCGAVAVGCRTGVLDFANITSSPPPSGSPTPDTPFGNGHTGPMTVDTPVVVNHCHRVTLGTSQTAIVDSTTDIRVGDKLLFVEVQDNLDSVAGGAGFAVYTRNAGLWELNRVEAALGSTLALTAPLSRRYSSSAPAGNKSSAAQVCTVPEYTSLTINAGGSIVAAPWDGNVGGIAAVLVHDTLSLGGAIDASGLGFRGGQTPSVSTAVHATAGYATLSSGSAGRGESIDAVNYGTLADGGVDASTNGGGGGDPCAAGGAGGSNGGSGGNGGAETANCNGNVITPNSATGGRGAAALGSIGMPMMWLGGAGGAGAVAQSGASTGAAGGGGIFVGARIIEGAGSIKADGRSAALQGSDQVGGGGGGAGGAIVLFTDTSGASSFAGTISASGGNGGGTGGSGPGGGGGGGRVARPPTISVTPNVSGGQNGVSNGNPRSATAGGAGVLELD